MKNILKNILFSIIIVTLFFVGLEIAWRIKVAYTTKDSRYLIYGKTFFEFKLKSIYNKIYNKFHPEGKKYGSDKFIMTFGGSTTACTDVKREDSWPSRLGYYLNADVMNYAQDATSIQENLNKYKSHIYDNKRLPDLVIFYMGINDASRIALDLPQKKIEPGFSAILNCRLMEMSLLYATIKEKYYQVVKKDINKAWKLQSADIRDDLELFQKHLSHVADLSNDFNIKLIICLVPLGQTYFDKNPGVIDVFNGVMQIIETTAGKKNIYFINIHKKIFEKYKDFDKYYIDDGIHLNEKGNDLIGEYLADYITRHKILNQGEIAKYENTVSRS